VTEAEWQTCERPFDMLCHLDGKVADEAFIPFSVACCRRVWPLITDPRARAVVEATESAVSGVVAWETVWPVFDAWHQGYSNDEVEDRAGGSTNEAVESVCGLGHGHAAQVSCSCFEAVGYAASEPRRQAGAPQAELTAVWRAAEADERRAQCKLLRQMFGYLPESGSESAEPGAAPDRGRKAGPGR
jgi:hypothetical protein